MWKPPQNHKVWVEEQNFLLASVLFTRRAAGVFVPVLTVYANQHRVFILLGEGHGLVRLRVSVACSMVSLGCSLTFLGSHHIYSSLSPCKPSFYNSEFLSFWKSFVNNFPLEDPCLSPTSPMTFLISYYCSSARYISSSAYPSWVSLHRKH